MQECSITLRADTLNQLTIRLLTAAGLNPDDARTVADTIVEATLRGVDTHGVAALPTYLRRIRAGATNPRPQVRVTRQGTAYAVIDADNGLGAIAATAGMRMAMDHARSTGIFAAACHNATTFGAAFYYSQMAAREGLIGIAISNAPPSMAPWGGKKPLLGTNPISCAFPRRNGPPIILDMATSAAAKSKIYLARDRGERIPEGWALDSEGRPTTDPEAALNGGLVMPLGGPKGYGLSLAVDLLTGALTGAGCLDTVNSLHHALDRPQNVSFLLMAIDPGHFAPEGRFLDVVEHVAEAIHRNPPAAGSSGIFLPGELEDRTRAARLQEGIPVAPKIIAEIRREAEALGVEVDLV